MNDHRVTRRSFLAGTAAAAAAPYVITSTALGNADTPPASERVTLGHIGVGGQGGGLFRSFQRCKGCQSVAVADAYKDRREACAAHDARARPTPTSASCWPATTSTPWSSPRPTTGTCRSPSPPPGRRRTPTSRSRWA